MGIPTLRKHGAGALASVALIAGLVGGGALPTGLAGLMLLTLAAIALLASALIGSGRGGLHDLVFLTGLLLLGAARGSLTRVEAVRATEWTRAHAGLGWIRGELCKGHSEEVLHLRAVRGQTSSQIEWVVPTIKLLPSWCLSAEGGCEIEGLVEIEPARGARGPGGWDDATYLASRCAGGWLRPRLLVSLGSARRGADRARHLRSIRDRCAHSIAGSLPGDPGLFAARFLLGRQVLRGADTGLQWRLQRAGVGHLWAVSGLHVGLIMGLLLLVLQATAMRPATRALLAAGLLPLYALGIGGSAAVMRAALMGVLWSLLRACGRRAQAQDLLLMVLALTLWERPAAWHEAGLQLSYLVTFSILGLLAGGLNRVQRFLTLVAGAQLTAWPLQLAHFGWGSPIFLVSNALLIPAATFLMPILLGSLLIAALPGYPPDVALAPCEVALEGMLALMDRLGSLCDRWIMGGHLSRSAGVLLAFMIALTCALRKVAVKWRLLGALLFSLAALVPAAHCPRLLMLDVGQGEGWLLFLQEETWAVDLGPFPGEAGRSRDLFTRALRSHGRTRIDRLFLTHDDRDHTGGIAELIARGMAVERIYHPCNWSPEGATAAYLATAAKAGTEIIGLARGDSLAVEGGAVLVLHPRREVREVVSDNHASLALRIALEDLTVLIAGDVPGEVQAEWLAAGLPLGCAVVTAAHHGSAASSPPAFLEATGAGLMLISAGRRNRFGHPAAGVIAAAQRCGIRILRTDRDGTILITRRKGDWIARGWRPGSESVPLSTFPIAFVGAP